ncbi:nucleotide-binding protein [Desulfuromonas versatilis]|uniref:Nucleotide-binding protein n=1 Tax=Desulfuromonas versatilis TaxID=2802975 RepID=A0ABN6E105_9BACT|nr:RNase adapter RapZ [Desulfuromonas versatilis]BCR05484.1 nucleotide-binding protein [Desulfuromonas versatilis]
MSRKRLIIITGLSGSGKTAAARALEDEGFFVVDNLPLALLPQFLELAEQGVRFTANLAVVIDVRNRDFLAGVETTMEALGRAGYVPEVYFLDASDDVLIRRYSETRRRHPLALTAKLEEGISNERQLLAGLRKRATNIIDTSWFTPHQLRAKISQLARGDDEATPMLVQLQSFGFRNGIPAGSDLVLDVRFIPNPHFVPELQPLSGLDREVSDYVLKQAACQDFLNRFQSLLDFLLPQYRHEGKSYLTISIGCTGGRHRSVAIVEALRAHVLGEGIQLQVLHRDIAKV